MLCSHAPWKQGEEKWNRLKWIKKLFYTAQKMKFFITDFLGKCDQIRCFPQI